MQDGIIAGNGSSRYLKTVAAAISLYPDYESFMTALIAGTFPIDLNGINADGWTQQGTPLNKANLFSDSTASALGLTASNTPNDAFSKIKSLIDSANVNANSKAVLISGYYTGSTNSSTKKITVGYKPKVFFINIGNMAFDYSLIYTQSMTMFYGDNELYTAEFNSDGVTINGPGIDVSNKKYNWFAIV